MIKTEYYMTRKDGVELYRRYSDQGLRIRCDQTGNVYDDAVNTLDCGHTYTETDEHIDDPIEDHDALNILLGRSDPDEQG